MNKKCPETRKACMGADCQLWQEYPLRDVTQPANAPGVVKGDCAHNWAAFFAYDSAVKLVGNQAAIESFRNETLKRHDEDRAAISHWKPRLIDAETAD